MKRIDINLTEKQIKQLKQLAKDLEISLSELLRRIIDKFLNKE